MNRLIKALRATTLSLLGLKTEDILTCVNGKSVPRTVVFVS